MADIDALAALDPTPLIERAAELVERATAAGATAADASVSRSRSRSVGVRNGRVEDTDASESDRLSLRVFVGDKVASVAADIGAQGGGDARALAERAVAMARVSPEDPYGGLAPEELLARDWPDLDLVDGTEIDAERLVSDAMATEAAALAVRGVTNSGGAGAFVSVGGLVLATSHGFTGAYAGTTHGRSVSVIAGEGTGMERDYEGSSRRHYADVDPAEEIGRRAGERTVRRLGGRKVDTQVTNVVFEPRVARGLLGTFLSAINGASVARGTTFLRGSMGSQVLPAGVSVTDDPLIPRRSGSRPFDGEGVVNEKLTLVEDGVLRQWLLSSALARELSLATNGRGRRSGSSVGAGATNTVISPGERTPEELMAEMGTGLYVTEMIGRGADLVTGDYSRGASGYWIENGEPTFPVTEVTVASTLQHMFAEMILANDLDLTYATAAPTIAVPGVTIAGN